MRADPEFTLDLNLRSGPQMAEYRQAALRIANAGHRHVLDWGAGHGAMSHLLKELGVRVTSTEYTEGLEGTTTARSRFYPDVDLLYTGETVKLPCADDTFDAAVSMGVLEHVHDPGASLDELARVLRPAGVLYCHKLPNRFSYLEAIARRSGMYHHGHLPNDTIYTLRGTRELFERHGYEVLGLRRANMLPLTLPGRAARALTPAIWGANRALARVPGLNVLATNVELVARAPG